MQGLNLNKGQVLDLKKADGTDLSHIRIGMAWDLNGNPVDLDLFVVDLTRKIVAFYNSKDAIKGVKLGEDNRTGAGDGDDETVEMDATQSEDGQYAICIDIHRAAELNQNFKLVAGAKATVYNKDTNEVLATFALDAGGEHTACIVGIVTDTGNKYSFQAKGDFINGDINAVCTALGL